MNLSEVFLNGLPPYAADALERLRVSGFDAWLVGGCVRDALMGTPPRDYDIATNALPLQTARVFADCRVITTGARHGTVTVLAGDGELEITTFRSDGEYADSRHPDRVEFVSDIKEDLSRRDFTVNAAACSATKGLFDPFDARGDIARRIIRCVGDPEKRFTEDALRIMRALRFASTLGFGIEPETARAIHTHVTLLDRVSRERLRDELMLLICGKDAVDVMLEYPDVVCRVIPEFRRCVGFDQRNPHHKYNVYEHCVRAMGAADPGDPALRICALLHDAGKPECFVRGGDGYGHFPGHEAASERIAGIAMRRLKFDRATVADVCRVISRHDSYPKPNRNAVRRDIAAVGARLWPRLSALRQADTQAKSDCFYDDESYFATVEAIAADIIEKGECTSPEMMDIRGGDLLALGLYGKALGEMKARLFREVLDGKVENNKADLVALAASMMPKKRRQGAKQ